jgi:prepilin-type processing-associated H-X9-DG protein
LVRTGYSERTQQKVGSTRRADYETEINEDVPNDEFTLTAFQYGWWYAGIGQRYTGSADMILGVREVNLLPVTPGSCGPGAYSYGPGRISNQCDVFHFWSLHPGGANFLFADGSVHFLPYSAAPVMAEPTPCLTTVPGDPLARDALSPTNRPSTCNNCCAATSPMNWASPLPCGTAAPSPN